MRRIAILGLVILALGLGIAHRPDRTYEVRRPMRATILGDSVARGAGDESRRGIAGHLPVDVVVKNLGIDGARTGTVARLLERHDVRAAVQQADAVILSIGGNDLFGDSQARLRTTLAPALAQWRARKRVERIVQTVRRLNPHARLYVLGLYNPYRAAWLDPQIARWESRLTRAFSNQRGLAVIPIADLLEPAQMLSPLDRFHPSAAGYRAIATRIAAGW